MSILRAVMVGITAMVWNTRAMMVGISALTTVIGSVMSLLIRLLWRMKNGLSEAKREV